MYFGLELFAFQLIWVAGLLFYSRRFNAPKGIADYRTSALRVVQGLFISGLLLLPLLLRVTKGEQYPDMLDFFGSQHNVLFKTRRLVFLGDGSKSYLAAHGCVCPQRH